MDEFLRETKQFLVKDLMTCKPGASLEEVAKMMLQRHVHRLYVLDDSDKLVGVVSTSDLCRFLAKALHKR